jgi:hypothetical protein
VDLFDEVGIEELYRRLAQARRMLIPTIDPITKERIATLVSDLENHIAQVKTKDLHSPE